MERLCVFLLENVFVGNNLNLNSDIRCIGFCFNGGLFFMANLQVGKLFLELDVKSWDIISLGTVNLNPDFLSRK